MRAIVLVVMEVLVHQPFQMPKFIQHRSHGRANRDGNCRPSARRRRSPTDCWKRIRLDWTPKLFICVDDFLIEARAAIKNQVARGRVIGKSRAKLLDNPEAWLFGCFVTWQWRIRRRSCAMIKEAIQRAPKDERGHGKEIHRSDGPLMIAPEKGRPSLCRIRIPWRFPHPAQHGPFRNVIEAASIFSSP